MFGATQEVQDFRSSAVISTRANEDGNAAEQAVRSMRCWPRSAQCHRNTHPRRDGLGAEEPPAPLPPAAVAADPAAGLTGQAAVTDPPRPRAEQGLEPPLPAAPLVPCGLDRVREGTASSPSFSSHISRSNCEEAPRWNSQPTMRASCHCLLLSPESSLHPDNLLAVLVDDIFKWESFREPPFSFPAPTLSSQSF